MRNVLDHGITYTHTYTTRHMHIFILYHLKHFAISNREEDKNNENFVIFVGNLITFSPYRTEKHGKTVLHAEEGSSYAEKGKISD